MVWRVLHRLTYGRVMPPGFASRAGGLIGTVALILVSALPAAAAPPGLPILFNGAVYGDFAMTGNSVSTCPRGAPKSCLDALERKGSGPFTQNNNHPMAWVDVDGDGTTFNSSVGRLAIPAGARVVHATLMWAGATGAPAGTPCATTGVRPPGSPTSQAVSLTVNGTTSTVRPERYTVDQPSLEQAMFYSARAEVTGALRGANGQAMITVGNVWTPKGYDCFGGWALLAVWAFDQPFAPVSLARRQITLYDTHLRVIGGVVESTVRAGSIRPAGGSGRIGVVGYEGDWGLAGDRFLVNGRDLDGSGNFFASLAETSSNPNHPNNMSIDVRTLAVPDEVIRAGDWHAELTFSSGVDSYLVQGIVVSTPMPELTAAIVVEPPVVHEGDAVRQTIRVGNAGAAPAVRVQVRAAGCDRDVERLDGGSSVSVTCSVAGARPAVAVSGESLIGDRLSAHAEGTLEVLRPSIGVSVAVAPIVLEGQLVKYEISVRNTGNTGLSTMVVEGFKDCEPIGTLGAGEAKTVRCSIIAGRPPTTVTVSGVDKLGKRVTGTATAAVSVVDPKVTMTVVPSTNAVRPGEAVTLTVRVTNPSAIPLGGVRVAGSPEVCARDLGTLAPKQTVTYTCSVAVQERLTTSLSVQANVLLDGQVAAGVRATGVTIVSVVPDEEPPLPPVAEAARALPLKEPAPIAALVAGLAVLSNFVTVGAIAATACRPK